MAVTVNVKLSPQQFDTLREAVAFAQAVKLGQSQASKGADIVKLRQESARFGDVLAALNRV